VRAVPPQARTAVSQLPPVEDALRREFAIGRTEGTEGLTASTLRPALNVRGVRSGQVGAQAANAIPVDAVASIDFRLVPDETPAGVRARVEAFLKSKGWTVVESEPTAAERVARARIVKLGWEAGYPALRTDMASPTAR
jgi:acetylornithine deacetylase/succinyl-diaminopimelate desuccinylase-like protein